jgi:putative transposase
VGNLGEHQWGIPASAIIAEYVDWFNHRRLHGELGLIPPAEYETNHWASTTLEHYPDNRVPAGAGSN